MAKLFELPRYIAVEGPIRVGKSTLSRVLAERLNAQRVMEAEDNPFLSAFYQGERGAAFQAQFAFLIRRFEQLKALDLGPQSQRAVVADFIFEATPLLEALRLEAGRCLRHYGLHNLLSWLALNSRRDVCPTRPTDEGWSRFWEIPDARD